MIRVSMGPAGLARARLRCSNCLLAMSILVRHALGAIAPALLSVLVLASFAGSAARADVGVILNESLDTSVARITGSGHSAVYLSRVCPASPVKLRLCRLGEMGSVISNYTTLGEDQPFEWNVVPLSVYLYGVEDPESRPIFGLPKIKRALEEEYRKKYLADYCASQSCRTSEKAEWREMVAATLSRSLYIFVVDTSVDQDLAFIKEFNSSPNVNHFNGVSRNCATFTRRIVDFYFPHAAHADYFNDFGMTSPKAIARSFTHFALHHSELNLRVFHFAQVPGTIKRSTDARSGTEQLFRSKKLLAPIVWFVPYEPPAAAGAYLLTGRFNPEREAERYPATLEAASGGNADAATWQADPTETDDSAAEQRAEIVGSRDEWKQYRIDFDAVLDEAICEGIVPGRDYFGRFAKQLDARGTPVFDRRGALWLEIMEGGQTHRVGVSANTVLSPGSDSKLAYTLLLAYADRMLTSPKHRRETMADFRDDWQLLEGARTRMWATFASVATPAHDRQPMPISAKP